MVSNTRRRVIFAGLTLLALFVCVSPFAFAASPKEGVAEQQQYDVGTGLRVLGLALGAGIALAGGALATGRVQAAVGASGVGVLAEKRDMLGLVMMLFVLPETLIIFGFVIAIMLMGKI